MGQVTRDEGQVGGGCGSWGGLCAENPVGEFPES